MRNKRLIVLGLLLSLSLGCRLVSGIFSSTNQGEDAGPLPTATAENEVGDASEHPLATPASLSPAAGICAEFEGLWVTITIRPDTPDPRCAMVRPDQMLEVVNQRGETLNVRLGDLEVELKPGERHQFEVAFGQYLAPGVHRIEVSPCCGAELVLP